MGGALLIMAGQQKLPPEIQAAKDEAERELAVYKQAQADNQKIINSRQTLVSQINENKMVEAEFKLLDEEEDAAVFKQVGPLLIPQELIEAKANVNKRLEYMNAELAKMDAKIKENNDLADKSGEKVMQFQQKMQAMQQAMQQEAAKAAQE